MANRPVFIPKNSAPYISAVDVEFVYNSGFAVSQKQKNITAIHQRFNVMFPEKKVLEISSKSMQEGGVELSAFNLMKFVPSLGKSATVETVYHSGKVFSHGGPFPDILDKTSKEAKRDERLTSSGSLVGFRFEGVDFPLNPQTLFYDYLYINALLENKDATKTVLEYDAFTDIEFNPQRSVACQARSAALFVALSRLGLLERVRDPEEFLRLFTEKGTLSHTVPANTASSAEKEEQKAPAVGAGDRILHKVWGEGEVISVAGAVATVNFSSVGEKKLGCDWIANNCTIL